MKDAILRTALEMAKGGTRGKKFKTDKCEGQVTTDYQAAGLGYFFGTVFEATVESNISNKKVEVRLLVNTSYEPDDVDEDGPWRTLSREALEAMSPQAQPGYLH
jgi:hypothetical protein